MAVRHHFLAPLHVVAVLLLDCLALNSVPVMAMKTRNVNTVNASNEEDDQQELSEDDHDVSVN